jgi:excisionase family DNA binding protein
MPNYTPKNVKGTLLGLLEYIQDRPGSLAADFGRAAGIGETAGAAVARRAFAYDLVRRRPGPGPAMPLYLGPKMLRRQVEAMLGANVEYMVKTGQLKVELVGKYRIFERKQVERLARARADLITVEQAAGILSVPGHTVRRMVREELLPAQRAFPGSPYRLSRKLVEEVARQRQAPVPSASA